MNGTDNRKIIGTIIILFTLSLGLAAGLMLTGKGQDIRKGAYYSSASLGIIPSSGKLGKGKTIDLTLSVNAGNEKVSMFTGELSYDNRYFTLNPSDLSYASALSTEIRPKETVADPSDPNRNILRFNVYMISKNKSDYPTGSFILGSLKLAARSETGTGKISFSAPSIIGITGGNDTKI